MRILYFHQHFSTPAGSAGTRSYEFARRLVARGHQVTIVCGSYAIGNTGLQGPFAGGVRRGVVDGLEVIELELPYANAHSFLVRTWTFLRYAARSLGTALRMDYDLLFATSTPLTVAIPGIVARVLRRRPFVFEVRDLWPELPKAMGVIRNPLVLTLMSVLESTAYRVADGCIGLAPGIVAGIRRKAPRQRVAMIPNGADLVAAEPAAQLPAQLANQLQAWRGQLKCVFAGSHGIANGLDAVLDAAAELRNRGRSDIVLILIGTGACKPALVARARNEGLTNCVFLDPIPKNQLTVLLARMDVGLMILKDVPAFYDGTSPNKFFDYLAAGLPVLINYPGWLATLVQERGCGHAVPAGSAALFADSLESLAAKPEERAAMGVRARATADAEFGRDQLAEQFAEFLESVGSGKARI